LSALVLITKEEANFPIKQAIDEGENSSDETEKSEAKFPAGQSA